MSRARTWTDADDDVLCELYGTMTAKQLAERMGRTYDAINTRAQALGLMTSKPLPRLSSPAPGVTVHRCL